MCTFYIDDMLVDSVRSSFKNETDLNQWMTAQMSAILKNFANARPTKQANWRTIAVSDKVKAMTLGPSSLSTDDRTDKELLAEALEEKYK